MYRLRRLYLDAIGVPDNRFNNVTVDFTGVTGEPTDAIVWLRNGAGKTTMLSLLLALILPDRRDFLASRVSSRAKNRTLEDLVLSGDTAHVCAEWESPGGQLLLTGAVYEWPGRIRPRDYNGASKDRLAKAWWCIRPEASLFGSTLDELPFTTRSIRSGRPTDAEAFKAHIRDLAARGTSATVARTITEWHEVLRERHFDPGLFHYFAEVNAAEGGMDALFARIDSPGEFVRYLLRFVTDERRAGPVRDLLNDTAVEIAKRPAYLAEAEFCAEGRPKVELFGEAHGKVIETAAIRDRVRAEAAGFVRALSDAASAADRDAATSGEAHRRLTEEHDEQRRASEAARRTRDGYARMASEFRVADARAAHKETADALSAAERAVRGWAAAGTWVEMERARQTHKVRVEAMAAAADQARPVLERLRAAEALLAGALGEAVDAADGELRSLTETVDGAEADKRAAENERLDAHGRLSGLDVELSGLAQTIADFENVVTVASRDGLIAAGEELTAAAERLEDTAVKAQERVADLVAALGAVTDKLPAARSEAKSHRQGANDAAVAAQIAAKRLDDLHHRAGIVANDVRVRDLLADSEPDVLYYGVDLVERLSDAISSAEADLLSRRADLAADEHAAHALGAEGLLPPRPAVVQILGRLRDSGITAHAGWRYVAENYADPASHAPLIAALPEVCDGVVVYGDMERALRALGSLEVTDAVVLAPPSVFTTPGQTRVVVGPAAARHDYSAGRSESERLSRLISRSSSEVAELVGRRDADLTLRSRVQAMLDELPPGGVAVLAAESEALAAKAHAAAEELSAAEETLNDLELRHRELTEARAVAELAAAGSRRDAERVAQLAATEATTIAPARVRREAIPALKVAAAAAEEGARQRVEDAEGRLNRARDRIRELREKRKGWQARRAGLPAPSDPRGIGVDAADEAVTELTEELREAYPEAELRRRVEEAARDLRSITEDWERNSDEVRALAEAFAGTPAGSDADLRAEEAARAAEDVTAAAAQRTLAERELSDAEKELAGAASRRTDLPETPTDRISALALADAAEAEANAIQLRVGVLERERDKAEEASKANTARAAMLRDQVGKFPGISAGDEPVGTVPSVDGEVRRMVDDLARQVEFAERAWGSASSIRSVRADELKDWAGADRFTRVAEDENGRWVRIMRERLRSSNLIDTVGQRAKEWVTDLAIRQDAIAAQLRQVDQTKENVVGRLAALVDDSLSVIVRASSLSELPEGIGPWAGAKFLDVSPRNRPTREQALVRVGELVDRMVESKRVEMEPAELLWRAVEASVIDGFRASVLKPAPEQPTARTPVENMSKWSGGENLTVSLILFCILARLRTEQRTGRRSEAPGGLVPLDNPLGKANYLEFLKLQRTVARATGVQLVFWTGIGDLGAVTAFPRIIAMHKRPSKSRAGVVFTVADEAHSANDPDPMFEEVSASGSVRADP